MSLALLHPLRLILNRFGPYFIEPVIAGINSKNEPFIAASDVVGCLNFAKDFVVSGTAGDKLFGMAEGLWEPDLVSQPPLKFPKEMAPARGMAWLEAQTLTLTLLRSGHSC